MENIFIYTTQKRITLRTVLLSFLVFFCGTTYLSAQNLTIKGLVLAPDGEPLIGVNVQEKGTANGTITDINGSFTLKTLSEPTSFVFSYISYKTKTVPVNSKQNFITVTLDEDSYLLNEVVTIGYGTVKKKDLTGAVTSIKASDLQNTASAGIDVALQGKIPGVFINKQSGSPGSAADIKIRGIGSFNSSGPLWVVDGIQQAPGVTFNMNDAESIEILRDGSAAAIYGAAAANGVILITTKRGKKGDAKINFSSYVGFSNPTRMPEMLSTRQLKELRIEDFNGKGRMSEAEMLAFPAAYSAKDISGYALDFEPTNADYQWKDLLFSQGATQNYDLSFTKGTDDYNYYASFNYYDEKGTFIDTRFKRYSFRLNSDTKVKQWLTFGESLQLTYTRNNPVADNARYLDNYMRTLPFMMPYDGNNQPGGFGYFPTTYADGTLITPDVKTRLAVYDGGNILADEYTTKIKQDRFNLNGSVFAKIQPIKEFTLTATFAGNYGTGDDKRENGKFWYHLNKQRLAASVSQNLSSGYGLTGQVIANYDNVLNEVHALTVMLGSEGTKSQGVHLNASATNMIGDIYQISLAENEFRNVEDGYDNAASLSYFGRINYGYKGKYLLMAMLRRDGYDRFGPDNRWGTFPSFSGAWKISDENFIRENSFFDWLTSLKLRASYGIVGNVGIPQFLYTASYILYNANYTYGTTDSEGNQNSATGVRLNQLPNHKIKWEEIATTDVGVDLGLFGNKLLFSFDWYEKTTTDALFKSSMPFMSGLGGSPTYLLNVGKIQNRGCDFELSYRDKIGSDFDYSVNANCGFFKNKVLSTNESNEILIAGGGLSYTQAGLPMGTFFAYRTAGVFQKQEDVDAYNQKAIDNGWPYYQESRTGPGDLIYEDVNGDGHIDSGDIDNVGNPWPDFMYGITLGCKYKGFDFSMLFQGVQGNDIYNSYRGRTHTFNLDYNSTTYILDRWTEAGSTNKNFRLSFDDPNHNETKPSTWFLEDGSYLRMKNIQLGFTLPERWTNKALISKCRLYISAQNLLTLTKYEGFDPEFSTNNNTAYGIDGGYYPQSKTVLCGIQIDF